MSFQGNVAGMGLAEVLQSIGRGDKIGVLNLDAGELMARLGMKGGLVFLLPSADEDQDRWRRRCQLAWADDPQPVLEGKRRETIARAARLESLYRLLEAPNVHFQFVPGTQDAWESDNPREASPWGQGIPVEFLLLEHARLSDENGASEARGARAYDMPRAVDAAARSEAEQAFLSHCDGSSTLSEVGDRLGWSLTQARAVVADHLARGSARLSHPHEILAQAKRELEYGRYDRASTRLAGWVERSPGGPIAGGERACLEQEWLAERLDQALVEMPLRHARALLRRMDLDEENADAARLRWESMSEIARGDTLTMLRTFLWRRRAEVPCDAGAMTELLRQARANQDRGFAMRSRTLLRLVASHVPEKLSTRLELGERLINSGLVAEGSRWLVDGARELIDGTQPDRALVPLRTVLDADPSHREAHGLLLETHAHSARRRRRRAGSLVGLAVVVILGGVAFVRVRTERAFEAKLSEVTDNLDRPGVALSLLEQNFDSDESDRITAIRGNLQRRIREEALLTRNEWIERFDTVRQVCEFGDPLLALTRTLELPEPPELSADLGPWPNRTELFNVLANHVAEQCDELVLPVDASVEELHNEQRLIAELSEVLDRIGEHMEIEGASAFQYRTTQLLEDLVSRRELRAKQREKRNQQENLAEQDMLLATARSHAAAGDLERAIAGYDRFFISAQTPEDEEILRQLYGAEADAVRDHLSAYKDALRLAESGDHAQAFEVLRPHMSRLGDHLLPWRVETDPPGARVTSSLGDERITPFVLRTGFGERVELTFELPRHEVVRIEVDRPGDLDIHLHRLAETEWQTGNRVEAVPVPTGRDHVVADRAGRIARLSSGGQVLWTHELRTLGGVARTPVFLGTRPGHLVVLTEDGEAWILDAGDGTAEGPWDAGSPPVEGPITTRSGVSARFADGRVAVWSEGSEPEVFQGESTFPGVDGPRDASVTVGSVESLRRSAERGTVLPSDWTGWVVEVHPEEYRVSRGKDSFTARREGEWVFVAWEDASALVPEGRLWISDDGGLRSYLPSVD
jgi:hypothetical protein